MSGKSRSWYCAFCLKRYLRPRRFRRGGGVARGECWNCGQDMHHMIFPIESNVFEGPSFIQFLMKKPDPEPGPRDWSPRGRMGMRL